MTVSDLQFAESKHRYTDPRTGKRLVSVTSVVGNFDSGDKLGAGAGAAVKLTKLGIDYRKEWNDKKDLGSRIHANIGDWALGRSTEVLGSDDPWMDGFQAFCDATKPVWLETERAVVCSNGRAGGRFDLIGEFEWNGSRDFWLLDPKTGKPYESELELQLAGYADADGMIVYDENGMAVGLEPMPYFARWGGLYLDGSGKATLVEVAKPPQDGSRTRGEVQEAAKAAFRSLLEVRLWHEERRKA